MRPCVWCDGRGIIRLTGVLCRACGGLGNVIESRPGTPEYIGEVQAAQIARANREARERDVSEVFKKAASKANGE